MSNRFEKVFQLQNNQYCAQSPVIVAAGVLLKDCGTGNIIAQVKLKSVSSKTIKAVKLSLSAFDVSGETLVSDFEYQYLDLCVENGQEFGANKAIIMPSPLARSFSINGLVVIFEDESRWISPTQLHPLSQAIPLLDIMGNEELVKQYRLSTTNSAFYGPHEECGLWQCACGNWNSMPKCTNCAQEKDNIFEKMDVASLTICMEERLKEEEQHRLQENERQEQLTQEKEAQKQRVKKYAKRAVIVFIFVAILWIIYSVALSKFREITMEKLLALETKEDVVEWLGTPDKSDTCDLYRSVSFMGHKYSLLIDYDTEDLDNVALTYSYPSLENVDVADWFTFEPTSADILEAETVLTETLTALTEKWGEPKIYNSPVRTTTYTWVVGISEISLTESLNNDALSTLGVIIIDIEYRVQSLCNHADIVDEYREASCTEDGYDRLFCPLCKYTEGSVFPALGHNNSTLVTKDPTCTEFGESVTTCNRCNNEVVNQIDKLAHDYKDEIIKEATCTTEGKKKSVCSVCGESTPEKKIEMLSHSYKDEVVKASTCTSEGIQRSVCTLCGNVANEKTLPVRSHTYVDITVVAATCTSNGEIQSKCSACGAVSNSRTIAATRHDFGQYAFEPESCTTDGIRYMSCNICEAPHTEKIPATGHHWTNATCTQPQTCVNCGKTNGSALGHDISYYNLYEATCTTNGQNVYYCKKCSYEYKETIPAYGHNFSPDKYYCTNVGCVTENPNK